MVKKSFGGLFWEFLQLQLQVCTGSKLLQRPEADIQMTAGVCLASRQVSYACEDSEHVQMLPWPRVAGAGVSHRAPSLPAQVRAMINHQQKQKQAEKCNQLGKGMAGQGCGNQLSRWGLQLIGPKGAGR